MNYPASHKVESCVSTDKARHVITHVHLDVEAKVLVSTDGRRLAMVPVEVEEGDVSGFVTVEAIKAASKAAGKSGKVRIACNGSLALPDGRTFPRPNADNCGQYPNWKQVVPASDRPVTFRVGLDAELLFGLVKALGESGLTGTQCTLEFTDSEPVNEDGTMRTTDCVTPIVVKVNNARGVLMPCRVS